MDMPALFAVLLLYTTTLKMIMMMLAVMTTLMMAVQQFAIKAVQSFRSLDGSWMIHAFVCFSITSGWLSI